MISASIAAKALPYAVAAMYGTDYSRWDNIKDSDDDATAPAPAPLPPQKPQSDQPLDPTNVAAMRELLHEIDDGRRPHLLAAIEWVEAARATLDRGEAVDDGQCPFDRGKGCQRPTDDVIPAPSFGLAQHSQSLNYGAGWQCTGGPRSGIRGANTWLT